MCRFDFFSTRWSTSFRNVSKLLILPYNLVWTTTSCCSTRISKHFRNLRSQNLHQNLARVDQFSKGFGVYIFGIEYFIFVFLRFPARFIGNVSELFISQYDLVGTSTFWCNNEMSRHSHFFGSLDFHPRLFRIAQFGKEFGAYIFLGEYFILISRNIVSNFIPKCSEIVHSTVWFSRDLNILVRHWDFRTFPPLREPLGPPDENS